MYESSNLECFLFLHCLHFAVVNSDYSFVILKPKQVFYLEAVFAGRDLLVVLPTGYGKSIIFHLLPALLLEKNRTSTSLWLWCVCRNRLFTWPFVTHLDWNVFMFPRSKYSRHPSTLVIKHFYFPYSGRHVTSVHQGLSQAGAGEEPGYEVVVAHGESRCWV